MITFRNWRIDSDGGLIARQYDHLSARLTVAGDIPPEWAWTMQVQWEDQLNLITLTPEEGGLGAEVTAEMFPYGGWYRLQLRGTRGETVRHTNVVQVYIPGSLSGDAQWPEVPTEFTQAEQRMLAISRNPPRPGEEGSWMLYNPDTGAYEASDIPLPEGGGTGYAVGHGLRVTDDGTLEVDTAQSVEQDNTLPITAAAVYTAVGNIEVLLGTI